ncbi:membrane protein [gut metagenome]|uniref:Membrane protein n=1 Tax=gut metagenome TaxID=749906 RepID=J9G3Y8_9ZZZZ
MFPLIFHNLPLLFSFAFVTAFLSHSKTCLYGNDTLISGIFLSNTSYKQIMQLFLLCLIVLMRNDHVKD